MPSSPSVATTTQHAHIDWSEVSSADVEKYNHTVSCSIRELPSNVSVCVMSDCNQHHDILDSYARNLLLDSASQCFPTYHKSSTRKLTGWKEFAGNVKCSANFWHRIWSEAGCPSSGVLFQIKKHTKSRYKHEVRRLKRKQNRLLQEKLFGLLVSDSQVECHTLSLFSRC